jgi:DNA polymerase III alpha subunit (gram-positive type)
VHGIHNSHVAWKDPIKKHLPFIGRQLSGLDECFAHNISADRDPLYQEYKLAGLERPHINWVDTLDLARSLRAGPCGLGDLAGKPVRHRALADAEMLEWVYFNLLAPWLRRK